MEENREAVAQQPKSRKEEIHIEIKRFEENLRGKEVELTHARRMFKDVFQGDRNNYKPKFGEGEAVRRFSKIIDQLEHEVKMINEHIGGLKDAFYSVHSNN